jgi:hypothetical protein
LFAVVLDALGGIKECFINRMQADWMVADFAASQTLITLLGCVKIQFLKVKYYINELKF